MNHSVRNNNNNENRKAVKATSTAAATANCNNNERKRQSKYAIDWISTLYLNENETMAKLKRTILL